jgi:hypothetical protein
MTNAHRVAVEAFLTTGSIRTHITKERFPLLLGQVYDLDDYKTPSADVVAHLQAIIDEAFGRGNIKGSSERQSGDECGPPDPLCVWGE